METQGLESFKFVYTLNGQSSEISVVFTSMCEFFLHASAADLM